MISIKGDLLESYIVLSRSILAAKYNDYKIILHYINNKDIQCLEDFYIENMEEYLLI